VPDQKEPKQPEDLPEFVVVDDDDDDYYGHYEGGWVDTDTEEEPMELREDHLDAASNNNEDATEGDGADPGAQEETMPKMVMMTQLHPIVVTRIQMMIQSQPTQLTNRHKSPIMRSKYIAWTLLKIHSLHFSGGTSLEGHAENQLPTNAML
jgi:hypothetical protein